MKTPILQTRSISLLLSLAALAAPMTVAGQAAPAQLSEVPPVTMGLWQTETSSVVTGVENTPMAGMASALGRAHVTQSCLTPEKWKSDIQGLNARQQHGCTMSNLHQDAHEVSLDEACTSERGAVNNSHVDILIDSSEAVRCRICIRMRTRYRLTRRAEAE